MAQTFSDWNSVPSHIESKIRKIWNGSGTACYDSAFDCNGDKITVYKLASYKVADNVDYLTNEQKVRFFNLICDSSVILSNLLHSLSFEIETVRIYDEVYYLPGVIVGTWPHCKMYGAMDEAGRVHT